MKLNVTIEPDRIEFGGTPKSSSFIFVVFSVMVSAISVTGYVLLMRSSGTYATGPGITLLFIVTPLIAIAALFFTLRMTFRSLTIERATGEITIVWKGLIGESCETLPIISVKRFSARFQPQSTNRSGGWTVDIEMAAGYNRETGKFDDEASTVEAVSAANALIGAN